MHVREKSLNKITDSNTVSTEEMIAFLEHLDQCDFCLDQMIEEEIRNTDQPAPDYLAEQERPELVSNCSVPSYGFWPATYFISLPVLQAAREILIAAG